MHIFSVSEFITVLNEIMRKAISPHEVGIEGEIAEYRMSQNKWIWFKIKDNEGLIDCFATVWQLKVPLEDGMQVRIYGYPKIHQKSGKFSFNVERVEPVGEGALRRAFELLKQKLEKEGFFAKERKRAIPKFPARIGLIASGESAAYSDFIRILNNRWGGLEIFHIHVAVQGVQAVSDIVNAFETLQTTNYKLQTIVLIRGGGSLEDLQAFNSEEVAQAIFASKIPVLVGVGHERDETIADYVADLRASTPSNAAELLVPDKREINYAIQVSVDRISERFNVMIQERKDLVVRLVDIFVRFADQRRQWVTDQVQKIENRFSQQISYFKEHVQFAHRMLGNLNPKKSLERGYSIVFCNNRVVKSSQDLTAGDTVDVTLARGKFSGRVLKIMDK